MDALGPAIVESIMIPQNSDALQHTAIQTDVCESFSLAGNPQGGLTGGLHNRSPQETLRMDALGLGAGDELVGNVYVGAVP